MHSFITQRRVFDFFILPILGSLLHRSRFYCLFVDSASALRRVMFYISIHTINFLAFVSVFVPVLAYLASVGVISQDRPKGGQHLSLALHSGAHAHVFVFLLFFGSRF